MRKKKSACSVRNDGVGKRARRIEGRPDLWSGLPVNRGKWGRLPCGCSGGLGFGSELRDDAELLHQA